MRRLALLIGAPDGRLHGVEGDLDRMEEALGRHGFACERLLGAAATRDGILGALSSLAPRLGEGDAAVVFFSGHGGEIRSPRADRVGRGGPREPAFYRCLIPTDIRESTATDFRGVLSIELDVHLAAIADRGAGAAVILDCCHSEGIVRGDPLEEAGLVLGVPEASGLVLGVPDEPGVRAYSLGTPWLAPIEALRATLRGAGVDPDALAAEADPRVIRLVACGPREIAVETGDARGRAGLFTVHLAATLVELAGRTTTWLALARRVRQRVMAARHRQRPVLKGPVTRLLFRRDEAPTRRAFALVGDLERPQVGGGAMAGIEPGDRLLLAALADEDGFVGSALVGRCGAASAELVIEPIELGTPARALPAASAIPQRYARPRASVRVRASVDVDALVRRALPASGLIALADGPAPAPVVAVIAEVDGMVTITTADGAPLRPPLDLHATIEGHPEAALRHLTDTLEALALARALADLEPSTGLALERARVGWSLQTIDARGRTLIHSPAVCSASAPLLLGAGVRLVITVRNALGLAAPLFAWIFLICPSGQVTLLSHRHPWGAPVGADEPYVLGERPASSEEGIVVAASPVLPRGGASRGELVLIAADGQADLRAWERRVAAFRPVDPLERPSATRGCDVAADPLPGHAGRFAVWHVPVEIGAAP